MPEQPTPERDLNEDVVRHIEAATESEPVNGEELLESEELRRRLREAKAREKDVDPNI